MKRLTSGCSPTVDLSGSEQTADSADLAVFRALYPRPAFSQELEDVLYICLKRIQAPFAAKNLPPTDVSIILFLG